VFEPAAGVLRPEAAVRAAIKRARALGARVLDHTGVREIRVDAAGVVLSTAAVDLRVRRAVVTTGAWLRQLLPDAPVEVVRSPTTWFRPPEPAAFAMDRFPVFLRELPGGGALFGHGMLDGSAEVKLGFEDRAGAPALADADALDRSVGEHDWAGLCAVLPGLVPGLPARPSRAEPCLFGRTPDGQFLLGAAPDRPRIVVGGGCGNHGFKHATGIGAALADLACGERPSVDIGFADPARFG
jgi:sarcosine oxidase